MHVFCVWKDFSTNKYAPKISSNNKIKLNALDVLDCMNFFFSDFARGNEKKEHRKRNEKLKMQLPFVAWLLWIWHSLLTWREIGIISVYLCYYASDVLLHSRKLLIISIDFFSLCRLQNIFIVNLKKTPLSKSNEQSYLIHSYICM